MSHLMALTINIANWDKMPTVDISKVRIAQGDLKSLSKDDYQALRYGLEDFGYCEPIVVWKDQKGAIWCADGAQRLAVLRAMRDDGWHIPELPVIHLIAADKADMMKKLALLAGSYGKASQESVSDFAIENNMDFAFIEKYTAIASFNAPFDEAMKDSVKGDPIEKTMTVCPECGHEF